MQKRRIERINFRPLLFCAAGAACGVFLYTGIRFSWLSPSAFLLPALFLVLAFARPKRELFSAFLCILLGGVLAACSIHLYTERYLSGEPEGKYVVTGTVLSFTVKGAYTDAVLGELGFDGKHTEGKLTVALGGEEVRTGDAVTFTGVVHRCPLPSKEDASDFAEDIRYTATTEAYRHAGDTSDPFLLLNGALYDTLMGHMGREEAQVGYALLTGNSGAVDAGVLTAVRQGGIAHIFAVSGLHIGIFYGAALVLFRPLKKYAFLPALALACCYAAVSGFSVSAVRALIMCAALGVTKFLGRKYDLIHSLSLAALVSLIVSPADFLTAGFRLSFAAVFALALFSGTLFRGMRRLHFPVFLARTLSATLSVQLFTFPILYELFGYVSLWGLLLNPVLVPLLPVLFLTLLPCALLSLLLPFAADVLLALPGGVLAALLFLFAVTDFSAVLTGFSLGTGGAVLLAGGILLSERVRFPAAARAGIASACAALFALCVVLSNITFGGCTIAVGNGFALLRTDEGSVLVQSADVSLTVCKSFLAKQSGGPPKAAVVLSTEADANTAFSLADTVYLGAEGETGLKGDLRFEKTFALCGMEFRFESCEKLSVSVFGHVIEFDFSHGEGLGADLFVGRGSSGLKFLLTSDIILSI